MGGEAVQRVPLHMLCDGVTWGGQTQIQWVMLRDHLGVDGVLWPGGLSPRAFYFAMRSTWYKTREASFTRVEHINACVEASYLIPLTYLEIEVYHT